MEHIEYNKKLAPLTTLKVGGFADAYGYIQSTADLEAACVYARTNNFPVYPLGGGSNILVSDKGFKGVVLHMNTKGIVVHAVDGDDIYIVVQAGEVLDEVISYCVGNGWWGLENLSHIPGSVGATPVQNVGAYGVEVADLIECVTVFNIETQNYEVLSRDACAFSYRDSLFKKAHGKKYIITEVMFKLSRQATPNLSYKDLMQVFPKQEQPTLAEIRTAIITIRSQKFPDWHTVGTAGSFFKNPILTREEFDDLQNIYPGIPGFIQEDGTVKVSLGYILDKIVGVRGYAEGNVSLFEKQALVLIAHTDATSSEIIKFAEKIIEKVFVATQIKIEMEVTQLF